MNKNREKILSSLFTEFVLSTKPHEISVLFAVQVGGRLDYYTDDQKLSSGLNIMVNDTIGSWHLYCMVINNPTYR